MGGKQHEGERSTGKGRKALVSSVHRGAFWKPCPGTTGGYRCCGYQILTPLTGCGMYCRYCALHAYFSAQPQVVFENFDDLEREVGDRLKQWKGVVRFGTGEFADSLYLEDRLGLSSAVSRLLQPYPNVLVEFKTKSDNIGTLDTITDPGKVVIGFSLNTPRMIRAHERDTASLTRRLEAARRCEEMGFWVSFHFDPMIFYPRWEEEYRRVVRRVFETLHDSGRIAWWSLGGLRAVPELKKQLMSRNRHRALFSGEMIRGEDGKLRYVRPIREKFYAAVREEVDDHDAATTLYLCMESPEVWKRSGLEPRIPHGLKNYLDRRAEGMLGLVPAGG